MACGLSRCSAQAPEPRLTGVAVGPAALRHVGSQTGGHTRVLCIGRPVHTTEPSGQPSYNVDIVVPTSQGSGEKSVLFYILKTFCTVSGM